VTFADAEAMVVAFLKAHVAAPVSTRVPNPRPASFVRVWRNGGSASNRVLETPQFTVDAYGTSTVTASDLSAQCREAFFNDYTEMPLVRGVEEAVGPYSVPDTDAGAERYRFTVQLRVRARRG
jgi:hypothetical protein